jgi:hypothetical protein
MFEVSRQVTRTLAMVALKGHHKNGEHLPSQLPHARGDRGW